MEHKKGWYHGRHSSFCTADLILEQVGRMDPLDEGPGAAERAYNEVLLRLQRNKELHAEVDPIKKELLDFEKGRKKKLSDRALNALAAYCVLEGVSPEDPEIRRRAEATLADWRDSYGLNGTLTGKKRSTVDLIAERHRSGRLVGGWLWMTERDAGRPEYIGHFQLSSRAILAAIEALLPYCKFSPFARKKERGLKSRASAAARFYHSVLRRFIEQVTVDDVSAVLEAHGEDLRRQFKAINPPRNG